MEMPNFLPILTNQSMLRIKYEKKMFKILFNFRVCSILVFVRIYLSIFNKSRI